MQEKMKVLTLLEDGKITAEEAIELLDALNLDAPGKERSCSSVDLEEKMKEFGKNVEQFAKEMGEKINDTAKVVEPKIKNATKSILEKTASLIDELAKTLATTTCDCEKEPLENENVPLEDEVEEDGPKEN